MLMVSIILSREAPFHRVVREREGKPERDPEFIDWELYFQTHDHTWIEIDCQLSFSQTLRIYKYTYIHTWTYKYIHIHTHTYIHTYTSGSACEYCTYGCCPWLPLAAYTKGRRDFIDNHIKRERPQSSKKLPCSQRGSSPSDVIQSVRVKLGG
jgi:hypothetical protein